MRHNMFACDNTVFNLSYLFDVITNVVLEEKAFAEAKANEAQ